MSIDVKTPVHSEVLKVYYSLKDSSTKLIHPEFKAYLEAYGLSSDINNIKFGLTDQQTPEGNSRNIGVYVNGDNMYDGDEEGNSSFAVVVDFLLRNSDSTTYLKYGDCLTNYLNNLSVGLYRWVQGVSYSLVSSGTNVRVTALMIIMLEPVTDGDYA
ncbi:MAG: hypothetical protein EOM67_05520 [Spirochaetia bacterium]|nr:hypothetical protein [Spirochaetia bacterium]